MEVVKETGSREWCLSAHCVSDSRSEIHPHQFHSRVSMSPQPFFFLLFAKFKVRKGEEGKGRSMHACVCVCVLEREKEKRMISLCWSV